MCSQQQPIKQTLNKVSIKLSTKELYHNDTSINFFLKHIGELGIIAKKYQTDGWI
jgi:hypothetical protein